MSTSKRYTWRIYKTNTTVRYNFLDDDIYYGLTTKASKSTEFHDTLPIIYIVLTALGVLGNIICIFHLISSGKFRKNPMYSLYLNQLSIKTIYSFFICLTILTSTSHDQATLYIEPTNFICQITHIVTYFSEMGEVFFLGLMWVLALGERNMIGFKQLWGDIKPRMLESNQPSPFNSNTPHNNRPVVEGDTERVYNNQSPLTNSLTEPKNWRIRIIIGFYVISILCCIFLGSRSSVVSYSFIKYKYCMVDSFSSFIIIALFTLIFLPITYALILMSSLFWKLFGGERDVILNKISESEIRFLKLLKLVSLLKGLEIFFLDLQSSYSYYISKILLEFSRAFGLIVIFVSAILFIYYENVFKSIRRSFFFERSLSSASYTNNNNNTRSSNLFRNTDSNDIDYSNLVESENDIVK